MRKDFTNRTVYNVRDMLQFAHDMGYSIGVRRMRELTGARFFYATIVSPDCSEVWRVSYFTPADETGSIVFYQHVTPDRVTRQDLPLCVICDRFAEEWYERDMSREYHTPAELRAMAD